MTDGYDDPADPGGPGGGSNGGVEREPTGSLAPSGYLRGAAVVIVAVIVGVLLMPSGTRAPRRQAEALTSRMRVISEGTPKRLGGPQ